MSDAYAGGNPANFPTSPAATAFAITPGASALAVVPRAVYVGTGGNLVCTMLNASGASASVTFSNVPAGTLLPIRPTHITGTTTASNIVGLY